MRRGLTQQSAAKSMQQDVLQIITQPSLECCLMVYGSTKMHQGLGFYPYGRKTQVLLILKGL